MGQLRIMGYNRGDDRSNACVEVEVESDGLVMYGAILEESMCSETFSGNFSIERA